MDIRHPATVEAQNDGTVLVQFVDLPDTFTEGQTQEEALFNAAEVLSAMLAWRLIMRRKCPPRARRSGAQLRRTRREDTSSHAASPGPGRTTLSELARAIETSWPAAKRLEDPTHWPSLKTLDRAAAALGKRLVLTLE